MLGGYWKRFAESATDWLNRYRFDPFFRTEANIIGLQIAFALVILGLVGMSFTLLYNDLSAAIQEGIRAGAASGSPSSIVPTVVERIASIKTQNLAIIVSVVVLTTGLFGYIIARITLAPTRNALASQKQFIGNIAHELRTPLAVIKTNTEVALMEGNVHPDLKKTLTSNIAELDRISEIINNLLSLSALVRPERMEFASVDLSALTNEVVGKFAHLAGRSGIDVTVRISPDTSVWGNSTALAQIVGNILKNAIQHSPRGGEIAVTVAPAPGNQVELIVQDGGIGIAQKDLFRIFEPFYRADPSRVRGSGGSGLGLTIVSELTKMHQGKIAIRSALGRGTTVSVFLPGASGRGKVGKEVADKPGLSEIAVDFSSRTF
jgi:signal transduction histidine kinase